MIPPSKVVSLFDVDNTLLDNDRVTNDLYRHLEREFGSACRDRYFSIFEELRTEIGYADYLGALQRYRLETGQDPRVMKMSAFLIDYPFAERLYPGSLGVLAHFRSWGPTVILSDGDVVFQPRKIECSGLSEAVEWRVLVYIHKEQMLHDVERRYQANHYLMVDDKLRILSAMKQLWKKRLTTIFVRQGHYALDVETAAKYPPADITIERIADLLNFDLHALLDAAESSQGQ